MPTIVDSLIVELGLDAEPLVRGRKQAEREFDRTKKSMVKGGTEIETGVKKNLQAFQALRGEVLRLMAVFTAGVGIKQFVENTIRSDAAVGRLSKQIGVSTEELSAWQGVLRRNGGTSEGAANALGTLTNAYEEFISTGRVSLPFLSQLTAMGLRLEDLKDPSQGLLKLADIFSKMDPKRAAFIGRSMGLDEATINLLIKGRAAVEAQLATQRKLAVVTAAQAAQAQRLQNALSSLKQGAENLGRGLLNWLAPALEKVGGWLQTLAEWAANHEGAVRGAFIGLGAVLIGLNGALLAPIAPFIALAAAAAALGGAIGHLVETSPEVRAAFDEVGRQASELWDTLRSFFKWVDEQTGLGQAIAGFFEPGGPPAHFLASSARALADALEAINRLTHGDTEGAKHAGGNLVSDIASSVGLAPARGPGDAKAAITGNLLQRSAALIKGFEGYRENAYYDVNAYRAGYGSDTRTDAKTGQVWRITKGTKVSREDAEADLQRRLKSGFIPKVARSVGEQWDKLDDATRASLVSIAYNYGSLPKDVLAAARGGNRQAIAAAISARSVDNKGINAKRRLAEAGAVLAANQNQPGRTGAAVTAAPSHPAGAQTSVQIDHIEVNTQATDANGIARDLGPAIRNRMYVTDLNRGLG